MCLTWNSLFSCVLRPRDAQSAFGGKYFLHWSTDPKSDDFFKFDVVDRNVYNEAMSRHDGKRRRCRHRSERLRAWSRSRLFRSLVSESVFVHDSVGVGHFCWSFLVFCWVSCHGFVVFPRRTRLVSETDLCLRPTPGPNVARAGGAGGGQRLEAAREKKILIDSDLTLAENGIEVPRAFSPRALMFVNAFWPGKTHRRG